MKSRREVFMREMVNSERREFLKKSGILITTATVIQPPYLLAQETAKSNPEKGSKEQREIEVSPVEDLMREHGVLARMLIINDEIISRLNRGKEFPFDVLVTSTGLIRRFIEDYHEKLEEDYLFPRFERAGKLVDLVKILLQQHKAGRRLTDRIRGLATLPSLKTPGEKVELAKYLGLFTRMYRPHKAREDTVLFPAFHSVVSPKEFDALGDVFEGKEQELFGKDGFEKIVAEVATLERKLGIYELSGFSPK
jgi:hemerythrin-like domain-containing protein